MVAESIKKGGMTMILGKTIFLVGVVAFIGYAILMRWKGE